MWVKRLTSKKKFNKTNLKNIPNQSWVYVATNKKKEVLYVWMAWAWRLQDRLQEHLNEKDIRWADKIQFITTSSTREAESLEKKMIKKLNPKLNVQHNS